MAFITINRQNVIIEAVRDLVGREDRIKDLAIKNYDENLLSESSAETLSSEGCAEELNCARHM